MHALHSIQSVKEEEKETMHAHLKMLHDFIILTKFLLYLFYQADVFYCFQRRKTES